MSGARDRLLQRRERLLLRSGQARQRWALQVQGLRRPLGLADRARDGLQWLARHPEWPLGAALLLVLLRPGRVLRWGGYAFQGYRLFRGAQRALGTGRSPLR